jgi:hypothetical protein
MSEWLRRLIAKHTEKQFQEKRIDVINDMCYTSRHDFGLVKNPDRPLESGMTEAEREFLWNEMAQIFDNCIAPKMDFKK